MHSHHCGQSDYIPSIIFQNFKISDGGGWRGRRENITSFNTVVDNILSAMDSLCVWVGSSLSNIDGTVSVVRILLIVVAFLMHSVV